MVVIESVVKKALERHYEKKYEKLSEDERKRKIEGHLKIIVPEKARATSASAGMATMGYQMESQAIGPTTGSVGELIDQSGYRLIYDSFSEGLEPIYYWVLDYMRDTYWGTGLEVNKTMDKFEASVGSGFFGDLGTRASIMQDRAMKLMTTINAVIRSVLNILYDLKEFDQRLELYDDLDSDDKNKVKDARLALKQFWMDKVDIQRGRASINMLTQQLQFVTLRDAFMFAESSEEVSKPVEKGGMDLNERVKRILAPRVADYLSWEKLSGKELERRYKIEKNYLKSQIESLKLYSQWAKPYFQAARKLEGSELGGADLVSVFNTLHVQTTLFGTQKDGDLFVCVEVGFDFRTIPHTMKQTQTGMHYAQGGKVDMQFRGFALNEEEKKAVEDFELHDGLEMAGLNKEVIEDIEESVKPYLDDKDEEFEDPRDKLGFLQELMRRVGDKGIKKEVEKDIKELRKEIKKGKKKIKGKEEPGPFKALYDSFKDVPDFLKFKKKEKIRGERGKTLGTAVSRAYQLYNVYKKAHGMYTE